MNIQIVKWASGILVLMTLCGFIGRSSVRLSRMEVQSEKVSGIEKNLQIMNLYMKLQDPILYHKAESLAN